MLIFKAVIFIVYVYDSNDYLYESFYFYYLIKIFVFI